MEAIRVQGVSKRFLRAQRAEPLVVFDDLNLEIETGKDIPFSNGERKVELTSEAETVGGMAVVNDTVYYALTEQNRIGLIDLKNARAGSPIAIDAPRDVAPSGDGRLLICSGNAVHVHDPASGKTTPLITGLTEPRAVASDRSGKVYVADRSERQQILVFRLEDAKPVAGLRPR